MFGNKYKPLLFIFLVGLLLRILFAFYLEDRIYWDDGFDYDGLAVRLLEENGYVNEAGMPTSFRAPGYPFFLSFIYVIFGHHFLVVRIVQSLLNSVTMMIIFSIAKFIFNRKVATISALIFAVYPLFIYTASTFFPTTLFIFLLSLTIFFLLKVEKDQAIPDSILAGFIFGLSALTVPTILAFFPLALIWLYFTKRSTPRKATVYCAIIGFSMILVLTPWWIRNYFIHSKPFIIATNGGYNFWMGNNEWATASTGNMIKRPENLLKKLDQAESDAEKESIYYQDAFEFIKKHPGRFVSLTFQKALNLWRLYPAPGTGYKTKALLSKILGAVSYGPVLIFAISGTFISWRQKKKYKVLFILLFFSFTMVHALFIAKVRFRLPLDPYLIILASYTLNELKILTVTKV